MCFAQTKEINPNDIYEAPILEIVGGNKSPTKNGMGYVFFIISPVGHAFIQNEAHPHKEVLEVGAGYSNIALEALKKGVGFYTVNDISEEHLRILISRIHQAFEGEAHHKFQKMKFLCAKAPQELPNIQGKYDAILIDKVLHFMKPHEIIQFISWTKRALKEGGKIYVTTSSPYSKAYNKLLPNCIKKRAQGDLFPGHFQNVMQNLDPKSMKRNPKYKIPNEIVLFSRTDLIELFEREGMAVLESYSLKIPSESKNSWEEVPDEESSVVGIIAVK